MSGAELALGIIPLALAAIHQYQTASETVRAMRDYKEMFMDLYVNLETSMAIYRNSMEQILSPLTINTEDLERYLCSEDVLKLWTSPEYCEQLKTMLGARIYVAYQRIIEKLFNALKRFVLDLKLDKKYQPFWLGKDGKADFTRQTMFTTHPGLWYRVRSGLKKGSFHNQLSMIEADVDRIRKMVATRPGTEQARSTVSTRIATTRRNKQDGKYFARVTEAARRFYASLNACWPVSCSQGTCAYVHTASLQIVDYTASSGADRLASRDQGQMNVDLKILFLLDEAGKPPEWNWKAVRVELEELERALGQPDNDCKLSEKEAPATWKFMRPKKPRVKFAEPQVLPPAHPSSSERIESLCQSLQKFNGTVSSTSVERAMRPCMGFLEEKGYLHYLYGTSIPACCKSKKKPITLGEAVNGGWRYPLKCLEKHTIAYLLASAVLQFHDTPWLRHNWTLNDVELIIDGSPSLARAQPIISKTFTQMGHLEDSNSGYRHTPSSIVKNPEMFSLALALLELYIGKPVMNTEEYGRTVAANGGVRNELTDYFAIKELLPVVEAREPENVYTAIYNCVEIHTMSKEYSLENDDFRQAFFDGVVLPLQSNYEVVRNIG